MHNIYIFLAEGYEPLEALAPGDVLKRAKLNVKFVSLSSADPVPSTQGYGITPDLSWDEFTEKANASGWDCRNCLVFPGGLPGADSLGECAPLMDILRFHYMTGGTVGAICAAPARVLARNLNVSGRKMTVYEGFEKELSDEGAIPVSDGICIDRCPEGDGRGTLITAKGPGLAIDFGLALLYEMVDSRIADVVKHAMML